MGPGEGAAIVALWHDSWHCAHAGFVPPGLIAVRSHADFAARLTRMQPRLRVAGPRGAPLGLCAIRGDELDQLFVSETAWGTGLAAALLADGEARIPAMAIRGPDFIVSKPTGACRFYTRQGWVKNGRDTARLETATGLYALETLLLQKTCLTCGPGGRMPQSLEDFAFRIFTVVGSALVLMFYSEFYFLNEAPANLIAPGLTSAPLILLLLPGYCLFAYLFLIVLDRFRVATISGLFLAGAIFGWATEALFVPIVYEAPPVSFFFPSVGWHALIDVLAGWYLLRLAMRRLSFPVLAGLFALLGVSWGLWATWGWEGGGDAALAYSMAEFGNIVLIASASWIIGTFLADLGMTRRFRPSRGEVGLAALAGLGLFAFMGLAFWPWMLALAALVGLTLAALWRGGRQTPAAKAARRRGRLADFAHMPAPPAYLAMVFLPAGALPGYWLVLQNNWALPSQAIVILLLISGTGYFFWSILRLFMHR